jgi:TetR/AcrR family transcriptional regulator, transcriptional repressor for nem operon
VNGNSIRDSPMRRRKDCANACNPANTWGSAALVQRRRPSFGGPQKDEVKLILIIYQPVGINNSHTPNGALDLPRPANPQTRTRLLDAALGVIRAKGYAATTVDDICKAAGLSKGSFFHHFATKEELAVAAARHWSDVTGALFAGADYHRATDPLDRLLAYVELRRHLIQGTLPEFTCLVGTMAQEAYDSSTDIRDACWASIHGHAETLVADIQAAMDARGLSPDWTAESLALHTQAVIQGGFILAKASGDPRHAVEAIDHLRRYIEHLFDVEGRRGTVPEPALEKGVAA